MCEHYFLANEITDTSKQHSILISLMGHKTYKILRNIIASKKPTDISFKNLVSAMTGHFSHPPSEIVERFLFNSRVRKQGETVAAYIAKLRALTKYCYCGDTLELMFQDQISVHLHYHSYFGYCCRYSVFCMHCLWALKQWCG